MTDAQLLDVFRAELAASRDPVSAIRAVRVTLAAAQPGRNDFSEQEEFRLAAAKDWARAGLSQAAWVALVLDVVARDFRRSTDRLFNRSRRCQVRTSTHDAHGRWVASAILVRTGISAAGAGRRVGLDHSTVLYGLKRVKESPDLSARVEALLEGLRAALAAQTTTPGAPVEPGAREAA